MTTDTTTRRMLVAMAMCAGLATAGGAQASADLVELTVIDRDTGQAARVWRHKGRLYIAGQPGARYSLRVTNNTGGRVLAVMSVDGVNILTGETAAYDQRGYVFGAYETHDINGWRKSDTEVAAFAFAPSSRSYAAKTGRPLDVGVIGVAVFRERMAVQAPTPLVAEARGRPSADRSAVEEVVVTGSRAGASAPSAPPAFTQRREERLGTAHGEREWSRSVQVRFNREGPQPNFIQRIEYDTYRNLAAAGVIRLPQPITRPPRAFPGSGYVPDPPGGF